MRLAAPAVDDMAGNDLTGVYFVFNKFVKYGYALTNLPGTGRSDPARPAGAAGDGRRDRGRTRRAVRHVAAGGVAASQGADRCRPDRTPHRGDRKSTRLNSSHSQISYAVF